MSAVEIFSYLIKSGGLLLLFWLVYRILLYRETFFGQIRWFFLFGVIISLTLPALEIERTVMIPVTVSALTAEQGSSFPADNTAVPASFSVLTTLWYIYLSGLLFFTARLSMQFISLNRIIKQGTHQKSEGIYLISSPGISSPFSFFNRVVIPQEPLPDPEKATILEHEFVHVKQWHSADIIITQIVSIVLWFLPWVWFYRKDVAQNLEYIADRETSRKTPSNKAYQYLLLKQHLNSQQLSIINPFINSFIKKRILMLQTRPSHPAKLWKLGTIIPLLFLFVFLFNIKTVAQYQVTTTDGYILQERTEFILKNNMTKEELSALKTAVEKAGGTVEWKKLKRNKEGLISSITLSFTHESGTASANRTDEKGITPIHFGLNADGGVYIGGENIASHAAEKMVWVQAEGSEMEDVDTEIRIVKKMVSSEEELEHIILQQEGDSTEKKIKVIVKGDEGASEDEHIFITKEGDSVIKKQIRVIVNDEGKENVWVSKGDAQDIEVEKIIIKNGDSIHTTGDHKKVKVFQLNGDKPMIILNGKEIDPEDADKLSKEEIIHVEVLKGDKAASYGEKGKNGVVVIKSGAKGENVFTVKAGEHPMGISAMDWDETAVFINDQPADKAALEALNPDQIATMEVLKGKENIEKYGKPNVILIKTKE